MTSLLGSPRHVDLNQMGASASGELSATGVPSDTFIVRLFERRWAEVDRERPSQDSSLPNQVRPTKSLDDWMSNSSDLSSSPDDPDGPNWRLENP
jgi:hypothetical protein